MRLCNILIVPPPLPHWQFVGSQFFIGPPKTLSAMTDPSYLPPENHVIPFKILG